MESTQTEKNKQKALVRILQVTSTKAGQFVMYAAAVLGTAALIPGLELPPMLGAIAGSIGVEAMGSIIERVARSDNDVSDNEIVAQVKYVLAESNIDRLLTKQDFAEALTHILKWQTEQDERQEEVLGALRRVETLFAQQDLLADTRHSSPTFQQGLKAKQQPAPRPPQHLIDEMSANSVIPMIGAGLSISSRVEGTSNPVMPDYNELLENLVHEAENLGCGQSRIRRVRLAFADGDTQSVARDLEDMMGYDFYRALRLILNPVDDRILPSPAHKLLRTLGFRHIITTNYDRLLEKFVGPNHEVVTPTDEIAFQFFTESLRGRSSDKYILKLHGDITRPETIFFGEARLRELYEGSATSLRDFLTDIFTQSTVLFLGYSFEDDSEGFVRFLKKYLASEHGGKPVRRHYALVPRDPACKHWRESLTRETGIVFLEYVPDENHSQVWEFISFLNTGKGDEPIAGRKWAQWYLPTQRHEYLRRQLSLETTARSVRFLTPTLTNAIATDDHLNVHCRSKLERTRLIPNYEENARYVDQQVISLMFERRNNLEGGLQEGRLEVGALFLKSELDRAFAEPDPITLERYRHLIGLLKDPKVDLAVRLIPDLTSDQFKEREATYALIYSDLPKPQVDVAIAYASQSTADYFQIHMIEINTETVENKAFQFERFWASAWSEQDSVAYIEDLVNRHS